MEKVEVKPVNALELDPEKDDEIEFERDSESNEVDKIMKEHPAPRQASPTKHDTFLEPGGGVRSSTSIMWRCHASIAS